MLFFFRVIPFEKLYFTSPALFFPFFMGLTYEYWEEALNFLSFASLNNLRTLYYCYYLFYTVANLPGPVDKLFPLFYREPEK